MNSDSPQSVIYLAGSVVKARRRAGNQWGGRRLCRLPVVRDAIDTLSEAYLRFIAFPQSLICAFEPTLLLSKRTADWAIHDILEVSDHSTASPSSVCSSRSSSNSATLWQTFPRITTHSPQYRHTTNLFLAASVGKDVWHDGQERILLSLFLSLRSSRPMFISSCRCLVADGKQQTYRESRFPPLPV